MSRLGRSAGLTGFLAVAREAGLDAYRLAAEAGVPAAALSDPDLRISSLAMQTLVEIGAARSGLADFGLRMAMRRKISDWGVIGLAVREQPTLRRVLELLVEYFWLQSESYALDVEPAGDFVFLKIGAAGFPSSQVAEFMVGTFVVSLRGVLGETWRPMEVCFLHDAPDRLEPHRRLFGVTPGFGQSFLGLVVASADLDAPLRHADPLMAREVTRYLEQLAEGRTGSFGGRVRDLIGVLLPSGACTIERVAERLGMDRRTVHRRLAIEGVSFSALVDQGRVELARVLVRDNDRPLQRVSELLGFSALSGFAHWFRRHFGCSASEWRASGGQPPQLVSWRKSAL